MKTPDEILQAPITERERRRYLEAVENAHVLTDADREALSYMAEDAFIRNVMRRPSFAQARFVHDASFRQGWDTHRLITKAALRDVLACEYADTKYECGDSDGDDCATCYRRKHLEQKLAMPKSRWNDG